MPTMTMRNEPKERESIFITTLKRMMEEKGVTQADIARATRLSDKFVSDVLNNRRPPFQEYYITQLARAYGFDREELLTKRAWTVRRVDIPVTATYKQVERVVRGLMNKE